jgi:hypothetical protein
MLLYYYIIIYVGESVTLKGILKYIENNSLSFLDDKDTIQAMLHDIDFNFGKYDTRWKCWWKFT